MGNVHRFPSSIAPSQEPKNPSGFKFSDDVQSPYLNAQQAARYLQLFVKDEQGHDTDEPNVRALYQFMRRHRITPLGDRRVLVDRRELDQALHPVKSGSNRTDLCTVCQRPTAAHFDNRNAFKGCAYAERHVRRIS